VYPTIKTYKIKPEALFTCTFTHECKETKHQTPQNQTLK